MSSNVLYKTVAAYKPKDIPAYMELRKAQDEIIKVYQTVPSR